MTLATDTGAVCDLLQSLGLPALVVEPVTGNVTTSNSLFAEFIGLTSTGELRNSFSERIWVSLASQDQNRWSQAVSSGKAILTFCSIDELAENITVIWSAPIQSSSEQAVLCVLFRSDSSGERQQLIAKGRELERQRLKEALHANFAQELLGAAFGAKLLADKLEQGRQGELAQSASALTRLLNRMAEQLPSLTEVPSTKE
jgi:signal transduction histidine kinase